MTTEESIKNAKRQTLINQLAKNNVWGTFDLVKVLYDKYAQLLDVNVFELGRVYDVEPTKTKKGFYLLLGEYVPLSEKQLVEFKNVEAVISFIDALSGSNKYIALYVKDKIKLAEEDYKNGNIITHIYSRQKGGGGGGAVHEDRNPLYHVDSAMEQCIRMLSDNVKSDSSLSIVLFNKTVSLKSAFNTDSIKQLQLTTKTVVTNRLRIGNLLSLFLTKNC
uniref:Uncharacterized protein n=1 Tax=Panulirus argus virus 1 TaxID=380624 RepID=A0A6G9HDK5_9VIRU|nr:hypothetical protein [Panulirus argus virus 1]